MNQINQRRRPNEITQSKTLSVLQHTHSTNICIMSLKPMYIARVVIYFYTYISIQSSTLWLCFSSYLSWLSILCHSKECNLDGNEINRCKHMEIMKSITSNLHWNLRNALKLNKFIANHRMQYTMIAYD